MKTKKEIEDRISYLKADIDRCNKKIADYADYETFNTIRLGDEEEICILEWVLGITE